MRVSQTGIDLIKYYEGLRLEAYLDVAGIWTIGYGHIGPIRIDGRSYDSVAAAVQANGGEPVRIDNAYAEELLREELRRFEDGVSGGLKRDINQNQFDAFVSLAYNIGVGAFRSSSALKFFNQGKFAEAADAITWWNKATVNGQKKVVQGLVNRRAAEKALFLQPVDDTTIGDTDEDSTRVVPEEENSPRRKNLGSSRTIEGAVVAGAGGAASAGAAWMGGDKDSDQEEPAGDSTGTEQPDTTPPETPTDTSDDDTGADADTGDTGAEDTSEDAGDTSGEDADTETPVPDETPPAENTGTEISGPPIDNGISNAEYTEAFQIIIGVIIVIAVLYIIFARVDDWMKHKR